MRFTSCTVEMKGLHWKGSLGLFNQFHSRKKAAGPPNKPKLHPSESTDVQWNFTTMESITQSQWSHMFVTTGRRLHCLLFPRVQIMPKSAVCRLHFALTYGRTSTEEDHVSHTGEFWQSHSSIGSVGLSFAGDDTDEDQARSPSGSTPCCWEKLFSTVLIYWSMTWTNATYTPQGHNTAGKCIKSCHAS